MSAEITVMDSSTNQYAEKSLALNFSTTSVILVDVKEVAQSLNLSERTIWRLRWAGKLPRPVSIDGKSKRWRRDELVAWIAAGCPDRLAWEAMIKTEVK